MAAEVTPMTTPSDIRPSQADLDALLASTSLTAVTRRAVSSAGLTLMGRFAVVVASLLVLSTISAANAESARIDDTARFLAGMQPSAGSPLLPLTQDPIWRRQSEIF